MPQQEAPDPDQVEKRKQALLDYQAKVEQKRAAVTAKGMGTQAMPEGKLGAPFPDAAAVAAGRGSQALASDPDGQRPRLLHRVGLMWSQ